MFAALRRPRVLLWAAAGVATLGFLIALESAARRYGLPGPITNLASEVVLAPHSGPLLYAGLALTMVVLTWRQRFIALGTAIGIDCVFFLVRWALDADMNFGNGALWVLLGCAVVALTRRTGQERVLLLKGAGLGMLLVAGHKTGDTWLLITSKTRPSVLDPYVATADHALGNPSWLAGRLVEATDPVGFHILYWVYGQLPLAAAVFALYQLRHVAVERRFPGHHLVRTFLVIGLLGPGIYMLFPVVGPIFAYGADGGHWAVADVWPNTPPPLTAPHPIPFDEITPRNCMPSLHTAWATAIFLHSRKGSRALRYLGAFWLTATLTATLGFGYHYGVDLIAGVVFTLTIDAAMRAFDRGWDRSAVLLVAYGTTVFGLLLASYRYLPTEMARHPWFYGPLLLLAMASVIRGYMRTTRARDAGPAPALQPEPQPELV
ncbi:inositol phosphorylceramide synthase [Streptomyces fructofermentans]|uniref:Inositol phosphorylceramide synthase n=1 Tax=Streptomyces fructofermentans TaxID=152141 RepID=A0A918NTE1_9ACTN|nr:phosphatase PAP2 family protein [Streptomyces fructofermentans]GGX94510.1 inositol phosphorylceramide synthase [Streptomyces fructofermentans]